MTQQGGGIRSALWLPIFDELADPVLVARLAAEAEEAGWHGVFVWDHLRWRPPVRQVADPWITLAAIATATERLRFGRMVTPMARRRPAKVARETATLDVLSGGRLTLGVGLGGDSFGSELSMTGEQLESLGQSLEAKKAELGAPTLAEKIDLTKAELLDLAKEQEIPGRSKMDHDELAATVAPS